jgi:molybdenum cofactor sulfurtransferase
LRHFSVTSRTHSVIFTSGATGALHLLAESFDFSANGSAFAYLSSNHTSVVGMWPVAAKRGARCYSVDDEALTSTMDACTNGIGDSAGGGNGSIHCAPGGGGNSAWVRRVDTADDVTDGARRCHGDGRSLFAYPAQCNLSGRRYPLAWAERVKVGRM